MFFRNPQSKIPSLLREGIFFLILTITVGLSGGCDSKDLKLIDLVRIDEGSVLLAAKYDKAQHFVVYRDGSPEIWAHDDVSAEMGPVKKISKLDENLIAIITEKNGIYLFPIGALSSGSAYTHLPVEEGALVDKKIRSIYYYDYHGSRRLYVLYETPKGSGATEILLKDGLTVDRYNHLDKQSSDLRSNSVVQIAIDMKGNVWFNYSRKEEMGLSRLDSKGEWVHFNQANSELPDKFVRTLRSEGADDGVDGDNIWFASISGLTRLEYKPGEKDEEDREKWKLYGERETTAGLIARAIGVRALVSDAVLDIIDLHVIEKNILMANIGGVYTFNGKSTNRYIPDSIGGLNDTQISDINYRDGFVIVKTRPAGKQYINVDSVSLLDLKKRKWIKIRHWDINKDYPTNMYFIPYKKGLDFVAMTYQNSASVFALFNYETMELKKIEFTMPVKPPDAVASEIQPGMTPSTEQAPIQPEPEKQQNEPETQAVQ